MAVLPKTHECEVCGATTRNLYRNGWFSVGHFIHVPAKSEETEDGRQTLSTERAIYEEGECCSLGCAYKVLEKLA